MRRWGRIFFFAAALSAGFRSAEGAPSELTLEKGAVFPRVFTPNGDGINDVVFFALVNPRLSEVAGKIYDLAGGEVAELRVAGAAGPTADSLFWDGRDSGGRLAAPGVYVYRIQGEGKVFTGTVAAAK